MSFGHDDVRGGRSRLAGPRGWPVAALLSLLWFLATFGVAGAGGGPENALLIVDPSSQHGMEIANHYRVAWGIPDANVLVMPPANADYASFARFQLPAFLGELQRRAVADHIDYVIVAPTSTFYLSAEGLVGNVTGSGEEAAPRRISLSSAYTLAFLSDAILGGRLRASAPNQFYGTTDRPAYLDSSLGYRSGSVSSFDTAQRYFVGFQLGYLGERGNSVDDLRTMIDRGVEVEATRPAGTFYYMRTDDVRSMPRDSHFAAAVKAITDLGGAAETIYKVDDVVQLLPRGRHDALGVMTGHAAPGIEGADMTLMPGAFADHLTSFAATFDTGGQEKLSRWIAKGAGGSMGTVEEPYVYGSSTTGKFPHPRLFVWYFQGMSLGESLLRAHTWLPFQGLFYGDPLTHPFATLPTVDLPDAPEGRQSGLLALSPVVGTALAGQSVTDVDVLVDGVRVTGGKPGRVLTIRTEMLPDGVHDLRLLARDDSDVRNQGRWVGMLETSNAGRWVTATVEPLRGELDTTYAVRMAASGPDRAREVQLWQHHRVLAAAAGNAATFHVPGRLLGAGLVELRAVALYDDGRSAIGAPSVVAVHPGPGEPSTSAGPPESFSYTAHVPVGSSALIDLPALGQGDLTGQPRSEPAQASLATYGGRCLLTPDDDAVGSDSFRFVVNSGGLESREATVHLRYCRPLRIVRQPADLAVCPGRPVAVAVEAEGGELTYRWFWNGLLMEGASGPSLELGPQVGAGSALVEVEVESWCGARPAEHVRSRAARLSAASELSCGRSVSLPWLARRH